MRLILTPTREYLSNKLTPKWVSRLTIHLEYCERP
jgi:hypothetical protein